MMPRVLAGRLEFEVARRVVALVLIDVVGVLAWEQ
jgi:hypothetical protein